MQPSDCVKGVFGDFRKLGVPFSEHLSSFLLRSDLFHFSLSSKNHFSLYYPVALNSSWEEEKKKTPTIPNSQPTDQKGDKTKQRARQYKENENKERARRDAEREELLSSLAIPTSISILTGQVNIARKVLNNSLATLIWQHGPTKQIEPLLKRGAQIDESPNHKLFSKLVVPTSDYLPFSLAAICNNGEAARVLLKHADIAQSDRYRALEYAAGFGHKEFLNTVVFEIEEIKKAALNSEINKTYIHEVVEDMLEVGKKMEQTFHKLIEGGLTMSLLSFAASFGKTRLVNWILCNSRPSVQNLPGPLHHAVAKGHAECVQLLLHIKFDTGDVQDKRWVNISPLHLAAYFGHSELVKLLLESGEGQKPNADKLLYPLDIASTQGHWSIVEMLLEDMVKHHLSDLSSSTFPFTFEDLKVQVVSLAKRAKADGAPSLLLMALKEDNTELAKAMMALFKPPPSTHLPKTSNTPYTMIGGHAYLKNVNLHWDPWLNDCDVEFKWLSNTTNAREHRPQRITPEDFSIKRELKANNQFIVDIADFDATIIDYAIPRMISYHGDVDIAQMWSQPFCLADAFVAGKRGHFDFGITFIGMDPENSKQMGSAFLGGACVSGNIVWVRECLEMGLEMGSALYKAGCSGQLEIVKLLLANTADINEMFEYQHGEKHTVLHGAAQNGHLEVVRELLAQGANVNLRGTSNLESSYLLRAQESGYYELMVKYPYPFSPLQCALLNKHNDVAKELINNGAILKVDFTELLVDEFLLEDLTTLYFAATRGNVEVVRLCMQREKYYISNLEDVLCVAAYYNQRESMQVLMDKGKQQGRLYLNEAINKAVEGGHIEIVEFLLAAGAQLGDKCESRSGFLLGVPRLYLYDWPLVPTSVHVAVQKGDIEMMNFLFKNGINPDWHPPKSQSLLFSAVQRVRFGSDVSEMVKFLLDKGATVDSEALDFALQGSNCALVSYLVEHNLSLPISLKTDTAQKMTDEIFKILLEKDATDLHQNVGNIHTTLYSFILEKKLEWFRHIHHSKVSRGSSTGRNRLLMGPFDTKQSTPTLRDFFRGCRVVAKSAVKMRDTRSDHDRTHSMYYFVEFATNRDLQAAINDKKRIPQNVGWKDEVFYVIPL